jgi:hypothetical protein
MGKSSTVNRFVVLEQRLAAAEYKLRLLWDSSLGHELRALEHSRRQRRVEQPEERRREEKRAAVAAERARTFKWFVRERVAVHPDLDVTTAKLMGTFNEWCGENKVPRLHWFETNAELRATMQVAFPAVEEIDVVPEGYLGKPGYTERGYSGIGVVSDGQTPAEFVRQLKTEEKRKAAARKANRELEEALYPSPTQPPPAFRRPTQAPQAR